jgi:hypothetical protein
MHLSNIESSKQLFPGDFRQSGLGDIWSDLMTTASDMYAKKTAATIQESQANQAIATANIAAANQAALAAQQQQSSKFSTTAIIVAALAAGGIWLYMRKHKKA